MADIYVFYPLTAEPKDGKNLHRVDVSDEGANFDLFSTSLGVGSSSRRQALW